MIQKPLGEFERMVMLAALQLDANAYGVEICRHLEEATGRSISRGAVYKTLDRLEKKGLVTWKVAASTPSRRRLPRRLFAVTSDGLEAVRLSQQTFETLTRGLDGIL